MTQLSRQRCLSHEQLSLTSFLVFIGCLQVQAWALDVASEQSLLLFLGHDALWLIDGGYLFCQSGLSSWGICQEPSRLLLLAIIGMTSEDCS